MTQITGRILRILVLNLIVIGLGASTAKSNPVGGTANVTPIAASPEAPTPATNDLQRLTQKAEQGDAASQSSLGMMYHQGQGVPQSDAEALKWIGKAAAQGYAPAQGNLGYIYYNGVGVRPDVVQAIQWYTKAAAQGYAPAQTSLAHIRQQQADMTSNASGTVGAVAQPQLLNGDPPRASAQPENVSPSAELAKSLFGRDTTQLQRENAREKLKGKVVQWSLPVSNVRKSRTGDAYEVDTQMTPSMGSPGIIVTITPRNENDRQFLASLNKGDIFTFRGVVKDFGDFLLGLIEIDPATLTSK